MTGTKRRAAQYRPYWTIMKAETGKDVAQKVIERGDPFDDLRFASGNYYLSKKEAAVKAYSTVRKREMDKERKCGKQYPGRKKTGSRVRPIQQLTLDGKPIAVYGSIREASDTTGIPASTIGAGCRGQSRNRQFIWKKL